MLVIGGVYLLSNWKLNGLFNYNNVAWFTLKFKVFSLKISLPKCR
jgi:hypothetical protein